MHRLLCKNMIQKGSILKENSYILKVKVAIKDIKRKSAIIGRVANFLQSLV